MHCHAELDPLAADSLLRPDERAVRDAAARAVDDELLPLMPEAFERGEVPAQVVPALARLGAFGPTIAGQGWEPLGPVAYGLMLQEIERCDSGVRSIASVQGALVMWPIAEYGSPEQRARWLPALRRGEALGCFALTEPQSGSDPGGLQTRARRDGDGYVLDGHKRWATNGLSAKVALVWAKLVEGPGDADPGPKAIRGFLVEAGAPGLEQRPIPGRMSLRVSESAELLLRGVRVPASAMLPGAKGLGAPLSCLSQARYGIAWGAVGAATACYASARDYAKGRVQFGRPLGARQLVQQRLAQMYSDIGLAQLACVQLGRLKERGELTPVQISLAKRAHVAMALDAARSARDLLGANGITLAHAPVRHLLNLETVKTYEGTHDVHTLVLGRHVTGLDAFSG
jgi:glutaryl-CoA dehydrogenase